MSGRLQARAALLLAVVTGFTAVAEDQGRKDNPTTVGTTVKTDMTEPRSGDPRVAQPRPVRVLFITAKGCERCEAELNRLGKTGGEFDSMRAIGWKIGETPDNHIQIVDRAAVPELAELLKDREMPTVVCIENGEVLRYFKHGCTTPLDAWTFGWLMKGQNERPKPAIPEKIEVETTGHYPLRGNHWTVDGDSNPSGTKVIAHLRGEFHSPQLATEWKIDEWSVEELRSLHDDLHERYGGGVVSNGFGQPAAQKTGVGQFSAGRKF